MRKLLVWDGDDSLWPGTIVHGTDLPVPAEHSLACRALAERGVLQSIASFNLPRDIEAKLAEAQLDSLFLHNRASLDREAHTKASMIRELMEAYGLARPSDVAFVDDDPMNRALVEHEFGGEVAAVHPLQLAALVEAEFTADKYTDEDRRRVDRAREELNRRRAEAKSGDRQSFLRSCGITMSLRAMTADDAPRVDQLLRRANRTAARAEGVVDLSTLLDMRDAHSVVEVVVADVADAYGSYGLTALAGLKHSATYGSDGVRPAAIVEAFVVSCRLQGRGIGSALLGWLINRERSRDRCAPMGVWVGTEYNGGVAQLYEWYGYTVAEQDSDRIALPGTDDGLVELPDWITLDADGMRMDPYDDARDEAES